LSAAKEKLEIVIGVAPPQILDFFAEGSRSLLATPNGAASKLSLWLPKNHEVQFGTLCLKKVHVFSNKGHCFGNSKLEETASPPVFANAPMVAIYHLK